MTGQQDNMIVAGSDDKLIDLSFPSVCSNKIATAQTSEIKTEDEPPPPYPGLPAPQYSAFLSFPSGTSAPVLSSQSPVQFPAPSTVSPPTSQQPTVNFPAPTASPPKPSPIAAGGPFIPITTFPSMSLPNTSQPFQLVFPYKPPQPVQTLHFPSPSLPAPVVVPLATQTQPPPSHGQPFGQKPAPQQLSPLRNPTQQQQTNQRPTNHAPAQPHGRGAETTNNEYLNKYPVLSNPEKVESHLSHCV